MSVKDFPEGFQFGTATAAYQVEGGWNADGKGANVFDYGFHRHPEWVKDRSNADDACKSYELWERDVEMCRELGVSFYRFSFSWSRILPNGRVSKINKAGVQYYQKLIDALLAAGIKPMVTLFHWDLPQSLQDLGGWLNPESVLWFQEYANFCFETFGSKVKGWITLNEPWVVAREAHGSRALPPGVAHLPFAPYLSAHHMLLSHAHAYRLYQSSFKDTQKGTVSICFNQAWMEPRSQEQRDIKAAKRGLEFELGWFAHPIFSKSGNYSKTMIDRMEELRVLEGAETSRLPAFSAEDIELLKGSSDYFGLNYYNATLVRPADLSDPADRKVLEENIVARDLEIICYPNPDWKLINDGFVTDTPWAFRKVLDEVRTEYDNPPVFIWENGTSDSGHSLCDEDRIIYLKNHINAVKQAIKDGHKIEGYTVWSLMDNFEWSFEGYTMKFGIYAVDFSDPNRKRTPKDSAKWYRDFLAGNASL